MPNVTPPHLRLLSNAGPSVAGAPADDALMLRAAAGDTQAYSELVERYQARVRGFCRVMLRDEVLAYDQAQEVFLKVWAHRGRYRAEGRFREFLFSVARNACRSYARKRAVLELVGLSPEASSQPMAAPEPSELHERLRWLEHALLRLPESFRVPVCLRFLDGLDYSEIARVIGRSESAARSRVFYGLRQLAQSLPEEVKP